MVVDRRKMAEREIQIVKYEAHMAVGTKKMAECEIQSVKEG